MIWAPQRNIEQGHLVAQMYALAGRVPCERKAVMIGGLPGADKPGALSQAGVGRPSEALTVEQEAVAIRRELAAASPDRYRPDLANALDNLGVWFSELGRPAEAAAAHNEATKPRTQPGQ